MFAPFFPTPCPNPQPLSARQFARVLQAGNFAAADWLEGRGLLAVNRQEMLEHMLLLEGASRTRIEQLQWLVDLNREQVQWASNMLDVLEDMLHGDLRRMLYTPRGVSFVQLENGPGRKHWLSELVLAVRAAQTAAGCGRRGRWQLCGSVV